MNGVTSCRGQLRAQLREVYEARTQIKEAESRSRLDREIARLTSELPPTTETPHLGPYDAAELQKRLLKSSKRALLAYFWGDSIVYGWKLTGNSSLGVPLGTADSLADLVAFFRTTIERPAHDSLWRGAARRVYQRLITPLAPEQPEQLLVITDGPLAHIPLEALLPTDSARPWGATQRIIYGPSASVLAEVAQTPGNDRWDRAMLAVGNPESTDGPGAAGSVLRTDKTAELSPLPYAEQEARALRDLFQSNGADLLTGRRASVSQWLGLEPARYRYLHFAAHAQVSDRNPEQTHLVLAGGGLDLAAIRRLRLRSELVTLSACETALGRRVRGEGVLGLSHAFLAAGARATLVTLWRIEDRSTAEFMQDFYRQLHDGRPPAEALLAVRHRWITTGGRYAHPAYWAPFVLVGGM